MKIVLLRDIKNLGQQMDVINVKDGYARNFLIPQKLAAMATKTALNKKAVAEVDRQTTIAKHQEFISRLVNETLEFSVPIGDKGEVFDPVSKDKIKKSLEEKGYNSFEVLLPQSLKELGEHVVEIAFPRGVKGTVRVIITPQR